MLPSSRGAAFFLSFFFSFEDSACCGLVNNAAGSTVVHGPQSLRGITVSPEPTHPCKLRGHEVGSTANSRGKPV